MKTCTVENCNNKTVYKNNNYCNKHHMQIKQNGRILKRTRYDKNDVVLHSDYAEIIIYGGKEEQYEKARTKIDLEDIEKCKPYKWSILNNGYISNIKTKKNLHRFLLNIECGLVVDHINHDTLDNRKSNLIECTNSQNQMNRKNTKGFGFHKKLNKWRAYIAINSKFIHLGYFEKKCDAVNARKEAEIKYFKEFKCKKI